MQTKEEALVEQAMEEAIVDTVTENIKPKIDNDEEYQKGDSDYSGSGLDSNDDNSEADSTIDALWHNTESSVIQAQEEVGGTVSESQQSQELLLQCPVCHQTETTQKACLKAHIREPPQFQVSVCYL